MPAVRSSDGESLMMPGEFLLVAGSSGIIKVLIPKTIRHPILWYVPPEGSEFPLYAQLTMYVNEQDKKGDAGIYWLWDGNWDKAYYYTVFGYL